MCLREKHSHFTIAFIISGGSRISQRRGRQAQRGGRQPIIWPIFPENCMKMKKFRARGGVRVPRAPP